MMSLDHRRRLQRIEAATVPPVRQFAVLQAVVDGGPSPTDAEIADQARAAIEAGTIRSLDDVFVIQLVGSRASRTLDEPDLGLKFPVASKDRFRFGVGLALA